MALFHVNEIQHPHLIAHSLQQIPGISGQLTLLSSELGQFFQFVHNFLLRDEDFQAASGSKDIASLEIRAFTSSSCVCVASFEDIAFTTNVVPPIFSAKLVFLSSTVITSNQKGGIVFDATRLNALFLGIRIDAIIRFHRVS